jgi:hypothetical protein
MSISIELPAPELAILKQITKLDNDAEAVVCATREYVRISRLRELKAASGKVEFDSDWKKLEELELTEAGLPQ